MRKSPQSAIFATEESKYHYYHLEYNLKPGVSAESLKSSLRFCFSDSKSVHALFAFNTSTANMLALETPKQLIDFPNYKGVNDLSMPSTQSDVFVWLKSSEQSQLIDLMLKVHKSLSKVASLELEVSGFNYYDSRDMIGFVDGTGNPKTDDLRYQAAVIPEDQLGGAGSYVMAQKWITNLDSFHSKPVPEQEKVVGRTKVDDIELEGDAQPANSHVSRTDIKVDGVAQKIWRSSSPYASAAEQGLYFLAFACELGRFESQIHSMLGLTDDGVTDRLMDFSTPVSGSYWFAPSQQDLEKVIN